ncbi:protein ADP-ribosyltransferase PARP3 isoform X1 [Gossypium arboreum]|uniref:protein ADP-ribosyltransferase PARP3 isoform X1 n=1 Tax=Gossypium arboreum TaxID=29729 RepID=UPI0022F16DFA|nr:protein ADP-ribosyltransferase PARP3 isoform X1 [Gossypium arboreum]
MKLHEKRSHSHAHGTGDEEKIMTRKQKADQLKSNEGNESPKKPKVEADNDQHNGKATTEVAKEFEEFCKSVREHLSVAQMREILEANGQDSSGSDASVVIKCLDMLFYGPLEKCQICNGDLEFDGNRYSCKGTYSEWSSCVYKTRSPARKQEPFKLPDSVLNSPVAGLVKKYEDPKLRPHRYVGVTDKPFLGMMISLMGRLSRTHQYWKTKIEKHGGTVSNSVIGSCLHHCRVSDLMVPSLVLLFIALIKCFCKTLGAGVTCLVASPAERERGGSSKLVEAMERGVRVVSEAWLLDSIEKQEAQPLEAYDIVTDLAVDGKGIPWDKQVPEEHAIESLSAELKLYGKRGVYKDTRLQEQGGQIFEEDGILYNCVFSLCDQGGAINEYCIMQLVKVPDSNLHLYYKKGRVGDDPNAQERLEEWKDVVGAVKEFVRLFEEVTGNEFEPWEREKKFQKKPLKFYPIDMDDGVDVRCGGLGLRQLGVAAAHCKLEPMVANFMKVLCSQEIYKYALMEMDLDAPDLPMGMLSNVHLERCEEVLQEFIEKVKSMKESGPKAEAVWSDFSQRWFTLMHSSRPFIFRDYQELADHAAASFECVRDIVVASHMIGHMGDDTLDDPLSDRYKKIGCSISPLDKDSEDYKMILNYVEKTYEPVKLADIEYGISVENIFNVETKEGPSFDEVKKLPNKRLLWCGTRSSNLLRHLHKGFLPASCSLPVPGYMFGKGIVCSDAAAEAARYGFTAVDRPEGFLVLAVFSQGEEIMELKNPPEDTKPLEEKKVCVKGLGRKKPDESEYIDWKDDIKVPCGRLIPSEHQDSPLEYNEYTVYDPKQVSMRFLVGVKFEEKDTVMDAQD